MNVNCSHGYCKVKSLLSYYVMQMKRYFFWEKSPSYDPIRYQLFILTSVMRSAITSYRNCHWLHFIGISNGMPLYPQKNCTELQGWRYLIRRIDLESTRQLKTLGDHSSTRRCSARRKMIDPLWFLQFLNDLPNDDALCGWCQNSKPSGTEKVSFRISYYRMKRRNGTCAYLIIGWEVPRRLLFSWWFWHPHTCSQIGKRSWS